MTTVTNPEYTDVVQKIDQMLFQALWEGEPRKDKKVRELDNIINQLLRRIGLLVESSVNNFPLNQWCKNMSLSRGI